MRAAFLVGCMRASPFCSWKSVESERSTIATEPDCYRDEYHGNHHSKPKTGRAQVCGGGELWAVDRVHLKGECSRRESHQTVFQHRGEIRSAECNPLEKRD